MKTVCTVGIDISSQWLDVALVVDTSAKPLSLFRVKNSQEGIESMFKRLKKEVPAGSPPWFCMEHTGNYGLLLCCLLQEKGMTYSVIPAREIQQSLGVTRGKSDRTDAERIGVYALIHHHKLRPFVIPQKSILQLKELISYRASLVQQHTQNVNSLKSHSKLNIVIDNHLVTEDLEQHIQRLEKSIKAVNEAIEKVIASDPELKQNFDLIQSVKGIGLIAATMMLVITQNFTQFDDGRKFACYAGTAPFEHSSGLTKGRTRVHPMANKQMKAILLNGANSAMIYDPEIRVYCQRKKAEGKHHKVIANAVACKLINRVFAVIKRKTPFVLTYEKKINQNVA